MKTWIFNIAALDWTSSLDGVQNNGCNTLQTGLHPPTGVMEFRTINEDDFRMNSSSLSSPVKSTLIPSFISSAYERKFSEA